jgi:hypothetical protein
VLYYLRADRVEDNVSRYFKEVALFLDKDRLESPLEDVTRSLVLPIDPLCVDTVDMAHAARQVRMRRFDQQMIVVGHQTVRVTEPSAPLNGATEDFKKRTVIGIGEVDLLSSVTTARNVVDGSFVFNPQWACHIDSVPQSTPKMKT